MKAINLTYPHQRSGFPLAKREGIPPPEAKLWVDMKENEVLFSRKHCGRDVFLTLPEKQTCSFKNGWLLLFLKTALSTRIFVQSVEKKPHQLETLSNFNLKSNVT